MLETLVIALREGIEAFLIVAITLAYLRKTGRAALASAVYTGTGLALVLLVQELAHARNQRQFGRPCASGGHGNGGRFGATRLRSNAAAR